jgi:hypothetical protein
VKLRVRLIAAGNFVIVDFCTYRPTIAGDVWTVPVSVESYADWLTGDLSMDRPRLVFEVLEA